MSQTKKSYGLYIPPEVLQNQELDCVDKVLLSEIIALHEKSKGCYASNEKFASMLNISSGRISKRINHLKTLGYLDITLDKQSNQKVFRIITPTQKIKVANDHTPSRKRPARWSQTTLTPSRKRLSPLVANDQIDTHSGNHTEYQSEYQLDYHTKNELTYLDDEAQKLADLYLNKK